MEEIGKIFDHIASITIVVQWLSPGVALVWAFKKRHPIIRHGKKLIRNESED